MYDKVQNTDNLDKRMINLSGGYRLFVPDAASPFFNPTAGRQAINMGHVRAPSETYTPTTKKIGSAVYGNLRDVLEVTTRVEETGTFETISVRNHIIRGLWAGSKAVAAGATPIAAFQANTAYAAGQFVVPTSANGHYYEVTTAGTTSSTEPVNWKTDGTTNTSGTVTFTDRGVIPESSGLVVIPRNRASFTGMLIDVSVSAIAGQPLEIFVAPAVVLRGDGYGSGRDGENETALKFAYTLLAPRRGT
ncbi:hypothetical protein [Deinococcus multiflagellatus]|uniref:Uncharacterized protein n=1 Tax=Deinococcus multiflagellatus TaxID=1656887 RepID=A0ABW1ZS04_9DEIO